jgi:hypothetical protein
MLSVPSVSLDFRRFLLIRAKSTFRRSASVVALLREGISCCSSGQSEVSPFGASCVWTDDDAVGPVWDFSLDIFDHDRLRPEVVNGYFKEALNLRSVQIHGDDMVAACYLQHVGDQLGRDGCPGALLSVHSRVGKARQNGRNAPGRSGFASPEAFQL